jgi:hypothetical protein
MSQKATELPAQLKNGKLETLRRRKLKLAYSLGLIIAFHYSGKRLACAVGGAPALQWTMNLRSAEPL